MSEKRGYISIHRKLEDNWIWADKPFAKGQAWIDLLILAKFKDEKFAYKDGVIDGKRGTVYRSITSLADRWGWSRDKARRFLKQLENDGMIHFVSDKHNTTITIVNYGIYQDKATSNRQPTGNKPTTSRQPNGTYNKDNNPKNENKWEPESQEEIRDAMDWFESL